MKGCHAVLAALLLHVLPAAKAADDLNGAVRELARRTVAFAGSGQPVSVAWRNLSSLGPAEIGEARSAFEADLRHSGIRIGDAEPAAELRLTISENQSQYLLVEEARKSEERQVWIAAWSRRGSAPASVPGISLDRKLIWEQDEQILDIVFPNGGMLVLSPARVTLYSRPAGTWAPQASVPIAPSQRWPRDLRGRLQLDGTAFHAYLPGMTCRGSSTPSLTMECHPGDAPWPLEPGGAGLAATFMGTRNYFDGRVSVAGRPYTVPPFYSAAAAGDDGHAVWLLAALDGRARLFDAGWKPLCGPGAPCESGIPGWGSDIASTSARCGGGRQVLATRASDGEESDSIAAYAIVDRAPAPLTSPAAFPGPVTALWPLDTESVLAVTRDPAGNRYRAYVITVVCAY